MGEPARCVSCRWWVSRSGGGGCDNERVATTTDGWAWYLRFKVRGNIAGADPQDPPCPYFDRRPEGEDLRRSSR